MTITRLLQRTRLTRAAKPPLHRLLCASSISRANLIPDIPQEAIDNDIQDYRKRFPSAPRDDIRSRLKAYSIAAQQDEEAQRILASIANTLATRHKSQEDLDNVEDDQPELELEDSWDWTGDSEVPSNHQLRSAVYLKPGDLLDLGPGRVAVCLAQHRVNTIFLSRNGRISVPKRIKYVSYIARNLISESDINKVLPYLQLPDNDHANLEEQNIPADISRKILGKIDDFVAAREKWLAQNEGLLDRLYDKLACPAEYRVVDLADAIEELDGRAYDAFPDAAKAAIWDALIRETRFSIRANGDRLIVAVLPWEVLNNRTTVSRWARQYQDSAARSTRSGANVISELKENPLTAFIFKARRLITRSRKIRVPLPSGVLGPVNDPPQSTSFEMDASHANVWTQSDKIIVAFLYDIYYESSRKRRPELTAVGSLILRALGAYPEKDLSLSCGRLVLKEMGCLPPWFSSDSTDIFAPLLVAGSRPKLFESTRGKEQVLQDSSNVPTEKPFADSMADLRQDWGDLEVFTIDPRNTQIFDDAMSFEPLADRPGYAWLHIHVAHPSAILPYQHELVRAASRNGISVKHSHVNATHSLFPVRFAQGASVGDNSLVLTTSTLIDPAGHVADIRVAPYRLKKVTHLDASDVDAALGLHVDLPMVGFTVGQPQEATSKKGGGLHVNPDREVLRHVHTLRKMHETLVRREAARAEDLPRLQSSIRPFLFGLKVDVKPVGFDQSPQRIYSVEHPARDPVVSVSCLKDPLGWGVDHSEVRIVSSSMVLACESMGKWMRDHDFPVLYRGSYFSPEFPEEKLRNLKPPAEYIPTQSRLDTVPVPFVDCGARQYVKWTSPLRDYTELLIQYQVNSCLRAQANAQQRGEVDVDPADLAFTRAELKEIIDRVSTPHVLEQISKRSSFFWVWQAFSRAFYANKSILPDTWDMYVEKLPSRLNRVHEPMGYLLPLGLPVHLLPAASGEQTKNLKQGQYLPVRIHNLKDEGYKIYVEAMGPPTDQPTVKCTLPDVSSHSY